MKYLLTALSMLLLQSVSAQYYRGEVSEDYSISIKKINKPLSVARNTDDLIEQLPGFPLSFPADVNTKNFRNISLEDINQDGIQDLLFTADNKLFAYTNNQLLWQRAMTGTGIYPPSIADIDNDGDFEIVQVTGGNGKNGRVYLLDHEGNNLPGFPKSYNDNWILTTATLSDLDGDGQMEIIFLERSSPGGNIHILKNTGEKWSQDWPIRLPGTPAVTPSVGDIDNDGQKEIVVTSTTIIYVFNLQGELEEGWPLDNPDTKFSFQSPILADLDGDKDLEIIGATHGNTPEYYVLHHDGTPYKAWPFFVPEREWTFSTPTIVKINDAYQIYMSRPKKGESLDMLYSWNEAGDLEDGFPINNENGLEGIISVADIDTEDNMEVIFGGNRLDENGFGFIHAFKKDGSQEVEGFPLRPKGWTLLNGAAISDINGDGRMDLTALSYTTNFGEAPDSIFINAYDLEVEYAAEKVLWSTYKGNNTRDGNLEADVVSALIPKEIAGLAVKILPNPIHSVGYVQLDLQQADYLKAQIITSNGQIISHLFEKHLPMGQHKILLPKLNTGIYFLRISNQLNNQLTKRIIAIKD